MVCSPFPTARSATRRYRQGIGRRPGGRPLARTPASPFIEEAYTLGAKRAIPPCKMPSRGAGPLLGRLLWATHEREAAPPTHHRRLGDRGQVEAPVERGGEAVEVGEEVGSAAGAQRLAAVGERLFGVRVDF